MRHEVTRGRENGCKVLPIRLDDAPMPDPTDLGDLDWLLEKHAMRLRTDEQDFNDDVDRIVTRIQEIHEPAGGGQVPWWRRRLAVVGACALVVVLAIVGFFVFHDDGGGSNILQNNAFSSDDVWAPYNTGEDVTFAIDVDAHGHASEGVGLMSVSATDGSIKQDLQRAVGAGDTVEFTVWVRSQDGQPIEGRLGVWASPDLSDQEPCCTTDVLPTFVADSQWRQVRFERPLDADHDGSLRAEIYVETTGPTLLIDDAAVHIC